MYISMLGYEVDFGMEQILTLVRGSSFSEKAAGYTAADVLYGREDEAMVAVAAAARDDMVTPQEPVQCLALAAVASKGGVPIAETLGEAVVGLVTSRTTFPAVRRFAALTALRLYRFKADIINESDLARCMDLLQDKDFGVKAAGLTLLCGLAGQYRDVIAAALEPVVRQMNMIAARHVREDYFYHHVPAPMYMVQALRFCRAFPPPDSSSDTFSLLCEVVHHILTNTKVTRSINRNNAEHAVLFEAVNLVIQWGYAELDDTQSTRHAELQSAALQHLTHFINIREPNIRYLGLEALRQLVKQGGESARAAAAKNQPAILVSLKDADASIRRRALDLLLVMADKSTAEGIVSELLAYLVVADFTFKEEMVLKIAVLAERYAPSLRWYVDTILQLLSIAGSFVFDDIWHRVVYIVTNHPDLQRYAAHKLHCALAVSNVHETTVKVGAYILGEYGYLLVSGGDGGEDIPAVSGGEQWAAISQHWATVSAETRALLLSTYVKFQNLYPELKSNIMPIFTKLASSMNTECAQRALEYGHLALTPDEITGVVLEAIPAFPERESLLEQRLTEAKDDTQAEPGAQQSTGTPAAAAQSAPTPAPAPAASAAVDDDLLALGGGSSATPSSQPELPTRADERVGITADASQVRAWWAALLSRNSGVLYEDQSVQLGVKAAWAGATGTLTVYLGNRTGGWLNQVRLGVPEAAGVKAAVSEVPATIAPGAQVPITISVEATAPFSAPPKLQLSFLSMPAKGHAYPLRLPLALTHFCEPAAMPVAAFAQRWGGLAGAPKAVTIQVPGPAGADAAAAEALIQGLHFAVITNAASGIAAAASFRTTATNAAGEPISVGCLLRVARKGDGWEVEARTQHPEVSQAIVGAIRMAWA